MGISVEQYRSAVGLFYGVHLKDIVQNSSLTGCVHPSELQNDCDDDINPHDTCFEEGGNIQAIRIKKSVKNICFEYRPKFFDIHAKVPISRIESDCTYFTSLWFLQCYIYMIYTGQLVVLDDFEDKTSYFVSLWFLKCYLYMLGSGKLNAVGSRNNVIQHKNKSVRKPKGTVCFDELHVLRKAKISRRKEKMQCRYFASVWIFQLYLRMMQKCYDSINIEQPSRDTRRSQTRASIGCVQSVHYSCNNYHLEQHEMKAIVVTLIVCFVFWELLLSNDIETNPGPGKSCNSSNSNIQKYHKAIVSGTFHQASARFSPDSQGRQCTPIAYVGILFSSIDSPSTWTKSTIDFLLTKGDIIYNACKKKHSYMDTDELPLTVNIEEKNAICVSNLKPTRSGIFTDRSTLVKHFSELIQGLTGCLFIACSFTVAVMQQGRRFYVLDSHSRHPVTGLETTDGNAVLMMFTSLNDIMNHFWDLYKLQSKTSEQYDIVPVSVISKPDLHSLLPPQPNVDKYLLQQKRLSHAHQSKNVARNIQGLACQGTLTRRNLEEPNILFNEKAGTSYEKSKRSSPEMTEKGSVDNTACSDEMTGYSVSGLHSCMRKRDRLKLMKEKKRLRREHHRSQLLKEIEHIKNINQERHKQRTPLQKTADHVKDVKCRKEQNKQMTPLRKELHVKNVKHKQEKHEQMTTSLTQKDYDNNRKRENSVSNQMRKKELIKLRKEKDKLRKQQHRSHLTIQEQEITRFKDTQRKQNERKQKTVVQKRIEQVKDTKHKLEKREKMTPSQNIIGNIRDMKRKKEEREHMTPLQREIENAKDVKRKKVERERMTALQKKIENAKDMKRKKVEREQMPAFQKEIENAKDIRRKKVEREQMTAFQKEIENAKDIRRKKVERERMTALQKKIENAKVMRRKKVERARMTTLQKETEHVKDSKRKTVERKQMTVLQKDIENAKDMKRKKVKREQKTPSQKVKDYENDRKRKNEQTPLQRERTRTKHAKFQKEQRANQSFEQKQEQCIKDVLRKKKSRLTITDEKEKQLSTYNFNNDTTHPAVKAVVNDFLSVIKNGPTFICNCCNRFLYRTSVVIFKEENLKNTATDLLVRCITPDLSEDKQWLCLTCHKSLKKNCMPSQAVANRLELAPIPPELSTLCDLERQLLSRIIPFMKIVSLPKSGQHGLKGQVVLVPSDVQKTADSLPRKTSDSQIIALSLKRRLSDSHFVSKQYIRPNKVNEGLTCLKNSSPHYRDITVNQDWVSSSKSCQPELWKSVSICDDDSHVEGIQVVQESSPQFEICTEKRESTISENQIQELVDSEDEVNNDNPADIAQEMKYKQSLNSSTCLYPEEGPSLQSSDILNLAPSEGATPTNVFYQKEWEALAFPSLFPLGTNTFHQDGRESKLTPRKYVNARLLGKDTRFAESAEYTFQCLHWLETVSVKDSVQMAMKKHRQGDLSVGQLRNAEGIRSMLREDELYASFKKVRGTPQYWRDLQYDMIAKVRQFGPYTFFISCSAADFHWPELIQIVARQYGEHLTSEQIDAMSWEEKRKWIARNPVTVARHIDYVFEQLWKRVILSGVHPIGQVLNYDCRSESQGRGTQHEHCGVHIKDAPVLGKDSDEAYIKFINDSYTCSIPDETKDKDLHNLVSSRQTHHHTATCKKKKGCACRFHFPRPPTQCTVIARMPEDEHSKIKLEFSQAILSKVMATLERTGLDITLSDLLKEAEVSEDQFEEAIQISKNRIVIHLQRKPSEVNINPYNPIILKALRANMDIQGVTDVWACIAYMTSYMCKPERTMSELMRKAAKEADSVREKLDSIGNTFLKSREVSQHEAIARVTGLRMKKSNTSVIFVPTGYKHERTRMIRPHHQLQHMDEDDTDIFLPNIVDKYANRPKSLHKICLAEFSSWYTSARSITSDNADAGSDNDNIDDENISDRTTIKLKNGMGTMRKRTKPVVIRFHRVTKQKDPEKHYHRLLILYLPWESEEELHIGDCYEAKFMQVKDLIKETVLKYEPCQDELDNVIENFDADNIGGETWDSLAPHAEAARDEEGIDDPAFHLLDPDILDPEQLEGTDIQETNRPKPQSITLHATLQPDTDYYPMVRGLNEMQDKLHEYIMSWCMETKMASIHNCGEPKPFYIFLSGGGGVGKSHTVQAIYQTAVRILRTPGLNPDTPTVMLTASTGKAAVNIEGTTLHTAFHLNIRKKGQSFGYRKPSAQTLNSMRATYNALKILIIDEISMTGGQCLSNVDLTLQDVFDNKLPFGGVSVLAVGDLLQLPPVGDRPVYQASKSKTSLHSFVRSVWEKHFVLHELHEIVRQKGDPEFAAILSRIRVGQQTSADIESLKALAHNDSLPGDCVSIFLTNAQVSEYNQSQLLKLNTRVIKIRAQDSKRDLYTGRAKVTITNDKPHETGGLAAEVQVAVNARYMHTKNTDLTDGLVNGAVGTITHIEIDPNHLLNGTIYVRFDNPNIGREAKKQSKYKNSVPIKAVTSMFNHSQKAASVQVERTQYPGTLAWGITVHKSQGSTYEHMIGDMTQKSTNHKINEGQMYTMLSRAKSRKGIKLISFSEEKLKVNESALREMDRMRQDHQLSYYCPFQLLPQNASMSIAHLNIRSLKLHYDDLLNHHTVPDISILCLTETHLCNSNNRTYNLPGKNAITGHTKHGSAMYVSVELSYQHTFTISNTTIEVLGAVLTDTLVVCVYIPPNTSWRKLESEFLHLLDQFKYVMIDHKCNTLHILGDFNITVNSSFDKLTQMFKSHDLQQLIERPTHILGNTLDLLFTNHPRALPVIHPVYFSDHQMIMAKFY